jgi:hypothetical protein
MRTEEPLGGHADTHAVGEIEGARQQPLVPGMQPIEGAAQDGDPKASRHVEGRLSGRRSG